MALVSVVIVGGTLAFVAVADHHERLPQLYYSLDESKPWNELAGSLDPRMSDGEYHEMRSRYFDDVVAPKVPKGFSVSATKEDFMRRTDRPWQWNRRPSRGEPPRIIQLFFLVSAMYLVVVIPLWTWRRVLKPIGQIARDDGLAGITQVILHGRKSNPTSNANR
jgi:hypothetical protein